MKKILSMAVALASLLAVLSGCTEDEFSTDQYVRDGVALNVYGPQPVTRGGQLRFLGSNLDRVVQVIIPGVDPITDIEVVQAGVPSEIRITVPKDGPEPGLVSLVTSDGQTLTTRTELTYSEPIEFEGFSPSSARPGDVITITGDYLNLIQEVIFSDEVLVSETDFESHTRYEIRVKVPEAAQTGVIGLGDIDMTLPENEGLFANVITSEEELTVVLPTVTDVTPLDVRPGDEVTVTGTLLNCISTIDTVSAGHIYLNGTDVTEINEKQIARFRRENLGFVFQDFNLLDTLTISENIALALTINRVPAGEIDGRVREIAGKLNITDILDKYPYQVSGGQKQRCACARAIINQPKLILADEPTGALDSHSSQMLLSAIQSINETLGATILMVTHDAFSASYANRILFLRDGTIFTEIFKGSNSRRTFFEKILDVLTMTGGGVSDVC